MDELIEVEIEQMIDCPTCGQTNPVDTRNPHMCKLCASAINNRVQYYRQHQTDWIGAARDAGIDLWERQPGETQWEFTIWTTYRDSYPGKRPSFLAAAKQLGTTVDVVRKIAQRWSFVVRMQAWVTEADRITLAQRRLEIVDMNKEHVDMANRLRQKISAAIDNIEPKMLKPSEINSLMKTATELERKARIDDVAQEQLLRNLSVDATNPELKKAQTDQGDLAEIVKILMSAGALGSITTIGVKETTTREVVMKDESLEDSKE